MKSPHDVYRETVAETKDPMAAIRAVRAQFGMSVREAKEVMLQAEGTAKSLSEHQAKLAPDLGSAMLEQHRFVLLCHEIRGKYLIVTNCSRDSIPVGTEMTVLYSQRVKRVADAFESTPHGCPEVVSLRIAESQVFRTAIDSVPSGYHAGVTFEGAGLDAVLRRISGSDKDIQVFLGVADR